MQTSYTLNCSPKAFAKVSPKALSPKAFVLNADKLHTDAASHLLLDLHLRLPSQCDRLVHPPELARGLMLIY